MTRKKVLLRLGTAAILLLSGLLGLASCGPGAENEGSGADRLFSSNYGEAREKFLEASRAAGAMVESYRNSHAGPGGEPLAIDVALLGPKDADSVLVVISGTHGVEGFAGSALQTGLLRGGIATRLKPGAALLMIHALNPYGFAHLRRFNEDNVDLNRNFVDHSLPCRENPGYEELREALAPVSLSPLTSLRSFLTLAQYRLRHGKTALKEAVTLGQYTHREGLFYGGRTETWSNGTLRSIAASYLSRAARVAAIEVHTGLGAFGEAEIILNERRDSPACRRARDWWGTLVKATVGGDSVSRDIAGSVKRALPSMLPDAEVTAVSLEFGTYPAWKVLRALRAENWLHHHGDRDRPDAGTIRDGLRKAFDPDSAEWRDRVWSQGREIIVEALRRLPETTSRKKYMEKAEPLLLEGGERGLLLLHGAGGGTTWDLKEFAAAAHRRGWTVWLPSLPGFGTRPEELIGITAEDDRISRTVAWSAPWKINNRLLPLLPLATRVPLVGRLVPARVPVETPASLKASGWAGYEWLPSSIGFPIIDVLETLHEAAEQITSPVLLIQGSEDGVIKRNSAHRIHGKLASLEREVWIIEGGSHVLMHGPRREELFVRTLAFLDIVKPVAGGQVQSPSERRGSRASRRPSPKRL
jgi:pimeloyl-ACP methyl ester carboxylesterase